MAKRPEEIDKIFYKNMVVRHDYVTKGDLLFETIEVQKDMISYNLDVPRIIDIVKTSDGIHKYSEWIEGDTLTSTVSKHPELYPIICETLGSFIAKCYQYNITIRDSHFGNFIWQDNKMILIDLETIEYNLNHYQFAFRTCTNHCGWNRDNSLSFLKGYSKYADVKPLIEYCDLRRWEWYRPKKTKDLIRIEIKVEVPGLKFHIHNKIIISPFQRKVTRDEIRYIKKVGLQHGHPDIVPGYQSIPPITLEEVKI